MVSTAEVAMKRALYVLLPLLIVAFAASCSRREQTIRIGLNAELTGSIPVVGKSCRNGAELAVKEINDAGGLDVGGKRYKIQLTVEDNEDKAESSAAVSQKLASEGVLAMIGPNASRNAIPAAEVAESTGMPMISPWSTNPKLTIDARTKKPKKYVFRTAFTDDFQGVVDAKFALRELHTRKPAVLYDVASEANKGQAEVYMRTMKAAGVSMASSQTYTTGDKDFSAQLTMIVKSGADSLFLPNYYSEVPLQVKQARQLGFTGNIFGSDAWGNYELVKLGGKAFEGLYFTTHYAADAATPKAQAFIKAYQASYGATPDDVAALTYDSLGLLAHAIKAAGKLDRESVRNALAAVTAYDGVTGTMQFKGTGDPIKSAVVVKIKNGKFAYFQTVKP
jgi:branched-chain amino acid transport system substrate-binding protein